MRFGRRSKVLQLERSQSVYEMMARFLMNQAYRMQNIDIW